MASTRFAATTAAHRCNDPNRCLVCQRQELAAAHASSLDRRSEDLARELSRRELGIDGVYQSYEDQIAATRRVVTARRDMEIRRQIESDAAFARWLSENRP